MSGVEVRHVVLPQPQVRSQPRASGFPFRDAAAARLHADREAFRAPEAVARRQVVAALAEADAISRRATPRRAPARPAPARPAPAPAPVDVDAARRALADYLAARQVSGSDRRPTFKAAQQLLKAGAPALGALGDRRTVLAVIGEAREQTSGHTLLVLAPEQEMAATSLARAGNTRAHQRR